MHFSASLNTPAKQQPAAVTPDAERVSEANERQSPDRSAAALEPCSGFVWSAEKPAAEGWWWCLDPDFVGAAVRRVTWMKDEKGFAFFVFNALDGWRRIEDLPSQGMWWAGPLPEPVHASARNLEVPAPSGELCDAREKGRETL